MNVDFSLILVIVIFFIVGFIIAILVTWYKDKNPLIDKKGNFNEFDILETLQKSKQSQIDYLNSKLIDISAKVDRIDSQLSSLTETGSDNRSVDNKVIHRQKSDNTYHIESQTDNTVKQLYDTVTNHNSTIHYILTLLYDKPKTSNEIMNTIGRTREHTSRLMKKMYGQKLVERDSGSRPFKYKITELGKKYSYEEYQSNSQDKQTKVG